MVIKSVTI